MTILIVEDDKPLRETFADILRQVGYRVISAENGRDALARIRAERPTFIFIDLIMPVMNGFELIQVLKADSELATIPIVAMTASGATTAPGALLMKKPFRAEAAVGLIEMHSKRRLLERASPTTSEESRDPVNHHDGPRLTRKYRQRPRRSRRVAGSR
jgi:CheY-like chemotaxis protein